MQGQNTRLLAQLANNDRVNNELVAERVKVLPPPSPFPLFLPADYPSS